MALRELAILLSARNTASGPIKRVTKDVSTLDRVAGRAGKGIRTMGSNLKLLGTGAALAGVGLLVAGVKSGIDSLVELENVTSATDAAIKAQGKSARVTAAEIRGWSEAIESATGAAVDDKAIQAGANNLVRFGAIGHDIFSRTLADATDLGAGMKTGPEAGAKLLGKALAAPEKAFGTLRKAGINFTKEEEKRIKNLVKGNRVQEAQVMILDKVEGKYRGAAAASAGPYKRSLNILSDAAEDAKMALAEGLLPVITKVATRLGKAVADPKVISQIREFGKGLASGLDKAIDFAGKIPWGSIGDAMKMAGTGAKAALDMFAAMPPWVQTAVVTGWGLNKLSGGALGGVIGELGKGLIKGVLGMNAGVVNIKAGVVNGGGGGLGGATGGKGGVGGKVLGALGIVGAIAGPIVAAVEISNQSTEQAKEIQSDQLAWLKTMPKRSDLESGLAAIDTGIAEIRSNPLNILVQGEALTKLEQMRAAQVAALGKLDIIASIRSLSFSGTANDPRAPGTTQPRNRNAPLAGPDNRDDTGKYKGPRARGGPVLAGMRYLVGERGPEIFTPGRSGGITPSGGEPIRVTVHTSISARESHRADRQWRRVTSANGSPVTID